MCVTERRDGRPVDTSRNLAGKKRNSPQGVMIKCEQPHHRQNSQHVHSVRNVWSVCLLLFYKVHCEMKHDTTSRSCVRQPQDLDRSSAVRTHVRNMQVMRRHSIDDTFSADSSPTNAGNSLSVVIMFGSGCHHLRHSIWRWVDITRMYVMSVMHGLASCFAAYPVSETTSSCTPRCFQKRMFAAHAYSEHSNG